VKNKYLRLIDKTLILPKMMHVLYNMTDENHQVSMHFKTIYNITAVRPTLFHLTAGLLRPITALPVTSHHWTARILQWSPRCLCCLSGGGKERLSAQNHVDA
jgi:hypothetical protein